MSFTLLDACRRTIRLGKRVGVLVNRLGRAASVSYNRCGFVPTCPKCDLALGLREGPHGASGVDSLFCCHCGCSGGVTRACLACD